MNFLDKIAKSNPVTKMIWMRKPKIESYKFVKKYTYGQHEKLLFRYEETDQSLRERIQRRGRKDMGL